MAAATFLLRGGPDFGGQTFPEPIAVALGRADLESTDPGDRAQLRRHVRLLPDHWPLAALTRQRDTGDAGNIRWLRADPAHVRADINGARLLALGDGLQLSPDDADAFLSALKPLFGQASMPIDAPMPGHWYLQLERGVRLPDFTDPANAIGDDVFEHLPSGDEGRRWRTLLGEAEVILHNHPRNAERAGRGLPPVNSLWCWGAGVMPDTVSCQHERICSNDEVLLALANNASETDSLADTLMIDEEDGDTLHDLRHERDLRHLSEAWLSPALEALRLRTLSRLTLDFGDGRVLNLQRNQRWRFWRKALQRLEATP